MQAGDVTLKSIFSNNHRYEIPMFQRPYVWAADREWAPLWDDIRSAADSVVDDMQTDSWPEEPPRYFLGSIVIKAIQRNPQRIDGSSLVDGQQRLTTLQVLLASARAVATELGVTAAAGRFAAWLENDASTIHESFPEDRHKLWPLPQDRAEYLWAVRPPSDDSTSPNEEHQLSLARGWFESAIRNWALSPGATAEVRLTSLHSALNDRMQVAMITLEKTDNAQVIFEALNHRGVELSQSDLIKNLLFRMVEDQGNRNASERLLMDHWLPLDSTKWRADVTTGRITRNRLDVVIAYWLTIKTQTAVSVEHLFDEFKTWMIDGALNATEIIKEIRVHADLYNELTEVAPSRDAAELVDHIVTTKTNTAWPLLLSLFAKNRAIPEAERTVAINAVGSYLMRRGICGLTTKDYNNVFVAALKSCLAADSDQAGTAIEQSLSSHTSESRRWPSDIEFHGALVNSNFYSLSKARIRTFFVGVENHLRDNHAEDNTQLKATTATLNIEHVLPQSWRTNWRLPSTTNAQHAAELRDQALNSLGNLTLTNGRLNSKMQNSDWATKRKELSGKSTLLITTSSLLATPETSELKGWDGEWTEDAIALRTHWLSDLALRVWSRPAVPSASQTDFDADDYEDQAEGDLDEELEQ